MPAFRFGGALGANADDPELATEKMLQGIGMPLRSVDLGVYSQPGYGGVENFTVTAIADIDATPQLLPAIIGSVTVPVFVVQDFANNAIAFQASGIWQVSIGFDVTFLFTNSPRILQAQFYNITDDTVLISQTISVGRNQEGAGISLTFLLEVGQNSVTDLFGVRILSVDDVFTTASLNSYSISTIHIDRTRP